MMKRFHAPHREQGVALLMALMFLVIITLISLSSMRTSTLELKMAANEQLRVEAVQSAQSAIDQIINVDNFPVVTEDYTVCFNMAGDTDTQGNSCNETQSDLDNTNKHVEVRLKSSGSFTCRACQSSSNKFSAAQFAIHSEYEDTNHGGRATVGQGLLMLIPSN